MAGLRRGLWPLPAAALAAGYLLRAAWPHPALRPVEVGLLFLLLAAGTAAGVRSGGRSWLHHLKGARGEERAARVLDALPPAYHVWHGVPLPALSSGGRDCDHVVIGPTGVFAVETINWSGAVTLESGTILVDGDLPDRPPIEQVKKIALHLQTHGFEAGVAGAIVVRPVLCFAGAAPVLPPATVGGVALCTPETMPTHMLTPQGGVRKDAETERLAACFDHWIRSRNGGLYSALP